MTILYHYCSNRTFHSIIQNRCILLSSLSLSNDSMEGKLVAKALTKIATADGISPCGLKQLNDALSLLENALDAFGFCLSEEGDLLSQWRGYASDGKGVSVGFNSEYLKALGEQQQFTLKQVEYEDNLHSDLVKPTYLKVKESIKNGSLNFPVRGGLLDSRTDEEIETEKRLYSKKSAEFITHILGLVPDLFRLKSRAFREEQEWRLISHRPKEPEATNNPCKFHPGEDLITPFKEAELKQIYISPIKTVFLGPKNRTPLDVMKMFLCQHGLSDVSVQVSESSYR